MEILKSIRHWVDDLLSVFFPPLCEVCGRRLVHGEKYICLHCIMSMPRCNIESDSFNTIHKRLLRKVPIERAAAYFFYIRGNRYTNLIQSAKYRNRPKIAEYLATNFANEIVCGGFFQDIDVIVPVPMHFSKKLRRGYNQSEIIAAAISEVISIPVKNVLKATRPHSTQTKKNALGRWRNSQDIYEVDESADIDGKHILLVDDVITTGSTLSACCEILHKAFPTTTISILTLAATEMN